MMGPDEQDPRAVDAEEAEQEAPPPPRVRYRPPPRDPSPLGFDRAARDKVIADRVADGTDQPSPGGSPKARPASRVPPQRGPHTAG